MTDKQKVTMASVILRRFGFTNREAAQFWGVREETVAKWVKRAKPICRRPCSSRR